MKIKSNKNGIVLALVLERGCPVLICRNVLPKDSDFLCTMCFSCASLYGKCELRYVYPKSRCFVDIAASQLRHYPASGFYVQSIGTGVLIEMWQN